MWIEVISYISDVASLRPQIKLSCGDPIYKYVFKTKDIIQIDFVKFPDCRIANVLDKSANSINYEIVVHPISYVIVYLVPSLL